MPEITRRGAEQGETGSCLFERISGQEKGTPCGPGSRCRGASVAFGLRLLTEPIDNLSVTRGVTFDGVGRREQVVGRFRAEIRDAAARNKATAIALVGSVARGDDGADSDYDFVVDFDRGVTLFDIGGLKADLEDLLDAEVDVVPRACLRDRYRTMLADAIPL